MPPYVATALFVVFIAGLFWLDREKKPRISGWLWIPVIWFSLAASRSASQWLNLGAPIDAADLLLEGNPVDRAVYTALLACGLYVLGSRFKKLDRFLLANLPIVLFFSFCAVSLFWSDFPGVAFKRWLKAVGDFVMMLVVWTENDPQAGVRYLLKRAAFVLMPLSILLIKYYSSYGRTYGVFLGEVHYTGVSTNKNTLGAICMLFGLATMGQIFMLYRNRRLAGRKRKLVANGIVLAIIVWLLMMASSMTSWSCLVMGSVLMLILHLRVISERPRIVHAVILTMLVSSVGVVFLGVSPGTLSAMGRDPTLTTRTDMWPLLVRLCRNPLIGTGFGSFWLGKRIEEIWSIWKWKPNEAHNGYLEIYLNLGWTGVVLLAIVLVSGYRKAFMWYSREGTFGTLLLAYFVVGIAYNFTEAAFFQMLHPVWLVLLLAMMGNAAWRRSKNVGTNAYVSTRQKSFKGNAEVTGLEESTAVGVQL